VVSVRSDDDNFSVTKIYNINLNRMRYLNELEDNIFNKVDDVDIAAKLNELIL
jgi:hypothetical protein